MRNIIVSIGTFIFIPLALGCSTPVGTGGRSLPPDVAQTCSSQCQSVGMRLTAVAIMAGNVGCVCEGATAAGHAEATTSATAGGMTAIEIAAEQQRQNQQQQQQASYSSY